MKIQKLETHDRLEHFIEDQSNTIFQGAEDCLKKNELSLVLQAEAPYVYLFAHPRTADDGVTKRMLWQPRLTKPAAQSNSYLFRAKSFSDEIEVCWLLPPPELWKQYEKENVTANDMIREFIHHYVNDPTILEQPHPDDLPDYRVRDIFRTIALHKKPKKPLITPN